MADSSCNSRKDFKYWEKNVRSEDGKTLKEVAQRNCRISVLGETLNSDRWDNQQLFLVGYAVNGRLEPVSLEFPSYQSHFMILFCNSNGHKQLLSPKHSTLNRIMKSGTLKVKGIACANKFVLPPR